MGFLKEPLSGAGELLTSPLHGLDPVFTKKIFTRLNCFGVYNTLAETILCNHLTTSMKGLVTNVVAQIFASSKNIGGYLSAST